MIHYISTRGTAPALSFEDALLAGLASDGGLYVPETIPHFSTAEIASMAQLRYPELAVRLLLPFVEGSFSENELRALAEKAYASFRHKAVAPLAQLEHNLFLLELFHGPTLAFKDFALQLLGLLLDAVLIRRNARTVVVGATSGDTGSAAISGLAGCTRADVFILYPQGRVSDVQRRQMTTVTAPNVHALAVEGTFDDCQDLVKAMFADTAFRTHHNLTAVNSINWARIMAQIVYYFYAALALGAPARAVRFSVPTGNFGDIYAGYMAKRMGLPVSGLLIATNANDILTRCLQSGSYAMSGVTPSLSPSMDIQISSNFERLLFDASGRDGSHLAALMQRLRAERGITIEPAVMRTIQRDFSAERADDAATLATMQQVYAQCGMLIDPHTAVGVAAARAELSKSADPMVVLATAHPAKFPDAVHKATGQHPPLPAHLANLFDLPERTLTLPNALAAVQQHITTHL